MSSSSRRPIIILGCPRSGTTLLQLMLHAHPNIAVPPETRFVLDAYQRRREFGDLRQTANRRALAEWITNSKGTRFDDLGLDSQTVMENIVEASPTLGSALATVFREYARRFDKPRWGDKRPGYFQHVTEVNRLFPDAQIVHLIRDGRDCVGSLKQMAWYRLDSYHAISTWAEAIDSGDDTAHRLGSDRVHQMRYEDLIADPRAELSALCSFLGEDFHPAMCEPGEVAGYAVPQRKTWHRNTHGAITTSSVGTWHDRLERWEVELCETVLAGRLRRRGYALSGARRASAGRLARYARVTTHRRLARQKRVLTDRVRRLREPTPTLAAEPAPRDVADTPGEPEIPGTAG